MTLLRGHRLRAAKLTPWLFLLPILIVHFAIRIAPSVAAAYYSLTDWTGIGGAEFIGLDNFRHLFQEDPDFLAAFSHNWLWLAYTSISFTMALLVAALLVPLKRGGMTIRTLLFIPFVLPSVVVASTWRDLLHPDLGIVALFGRVFGIAGLDRAFLAVPQTSLFAVFFIDNWRWWVFLMILLLTAMQNIDREQYESARVDGATAWQEFFHITLPGIRPTLMFLALMVCIWTFLVFDYVFLLTGGGPGNSSEVLGTLLFTHAFLNFEAGYAAAIGIAMTLISSLFIAMFVFLRRRGWDI